MEFEHREGWSSGTVAIAIRERVELDEGGTFTVPEEYRDAGTLQRLVDAGHEPVDPSALPDGVAYDGGDDAAEAEENEAETDGEQNTDEEDPPPDDDLGDKSRSDMWELAHSDEFEEEPPFSWNESNEEKLREWIREQRTED